MSLLRKKKKKSELSILIHRVLRNGTKKWELKYKASSNDKFNPTKKRYERNS